MVVQKDLRARQSESVVETRATGALDVANSITRCLIAYRAGDRDAAQFLWDRYYTRLMRLARARLQTTDGLVDDEEDIAVCVFKSFCRVLEAGGFPELNDRDSLWRLLVRITLNKVISAHRFRTSQKRLPPKNDDRQSATRVEELVDRSPSSELLVQASETLDQLLKSLPDGRLREIAIYRLEGFGNQEIADRLKCSERSVERKLSRIRSEWIHMAREDHE